MSETTNSDELSIDDWKLIAKGLTMVAVAQALLNFQVIVL